MRVVMTAFRQVEVAAKGRAEVEAFRTMRSRDGTYSWLALVREGTAYSKPLPSMMEVATPKRAASTSSRTAGASLSTT